MNLLDNFFDLLHLSYFQLLSCAMVTLPISFLEISCQKFKTKTKKFLERKNKKWWQKYIIIPFAFPHRNLNQIYVLLHVQQVRHQGGRDMDHPS